MPAPQDLIYILIVEASNRVAAIKHHIRLYRFSVTFLQLSYGISVEAQAGKPYNGTLLFVQRVSRVGFLISDVHVTHDPSMFKFVVVASDFPSFHSGFSLPWRETLSEVFSGMC